MILWKKHLNKEKEEKVELCISLYLIFIVTARHLYAVNSRPSKPAKHCA